jgi:hypothetical protein
MHIKLWARNKERLHLGNVPQIKECKSHLHKTWYDNLAREIQTAVSISATISFSKRQPRIQPVELTEIKFTHYLACSSTMKHADFVLRIRTFCPVILHHWPSGSQSLKWLHLKGSSSFLRWSNHHLAKHWEPLIPSHNTTVKTSHLMLLCAVWQN